VIAIVVRVRTPAICDIGARSPGRTPDRSRARRGAAFSSVIRVLEAES
jgi:hypothetical protein